MASILEALSQGLRGAGAVYSPGVYDTQNIERERGLEREQRNKEMVLGLLANAVEKGVMSPEDFQQRTQGMGLGRLPLGPSAETRNYQAEQQTLSRRNQYRQAAKDAAFKKTGLQVMPDDPTMAAQPDGTFKMATIDLDRPANELGQQIDYANELIRSGDPELVKEGTELLKAVTPKDEKVSSLGLLQQERAQAASRFGEDSEVVRQYDAAIQKETQVSKNVQFVELPTGRMVNGKPEVQNWAVVGQNPDGTPKLAKQGQSAPKGALSETNISMGDKEYDKTFGKGVAEDDLNLYKGARDAAGSISKLDDVIEHLENSDAITGLGAEVFKNLERVKTLLTESEKSGKRVSDTELLDTMLGSDVFPMIGALGIGARGMDTPAEREFLRQVMTGTVSMNKETLIKMAQIRRNVAARAVEKWQSREKTLPAGTLEKYGIERGTITAPPSRDPKVKKKPAQESFSSKPNPEDFDVGDVMNGPDGQFTLKIVKGKKQWVK